MPPQMPERRSHERYPTDLPAWIAGKNSDPAIPCTVWDLSQAGVRLVIHDPADVPVEFELIVPSEGARAKVRLIWTTGIQYGAVFID